MDSTVPKFVTPCRSSGTPSTGRTSPSPSSGRRWKASAKILEMNSHRPPPCLSCSSHSSPLQSGNRIAVCHADVGGALLGELRHRGGAHPDRVAYSPVMPETARTPREFREKMNRQGVLRAATRLRNGGHRVRPSLSARSEAHGVAENFAGGYIFRRSPGRPTPKLEASVQRARQAFVRPRGRDIKMNAGPGLPPSLLVDTFPLCVDSRRP